MLDDRQLESLSKSRSFAPGPNCLSDEELAVAAAMESGETVALFDHISSCDRCGERLRTLVRISREALSPEEEALVAKLKPPPPAARHEPVRRRLKFLSLPPYPVLAAAALALFASLGTWWYFQQPERRAGRLLAQAFTERREFDWRLPDAGWTPRSLQRAPDTGRSASLLEAQALLARSAAESSAELLDLQARADLLQFRIDAAVRLLERAAAMDSRSAAILIDLAIAYALRADSDPEKRSTDYGAALEYATRAAQLDARNTRVLFNRAFLFERLGMVDQAIAEWQTFVELETDTHWVREARERLSQLQQLKDRDRDAR